MSKLISGIAASDGYAHAKVYRLIEPDLTVERKKIEDPAVEIERFENSVKQSLAEIEKIRAIAAESLGEEEAQVFDAHAMILADPDMTQQVEEMIESNKINAESAYHEVTETFIQLFESMDDNAYMQERAADIKDIRKRVLANLLGVNLPSPATIDEEVIVVAHDLTPSDTAQLNKKYVKAFVTNIGGRTSHSAIMARSLEIPAIVGTGTISEEAGAEDFLIVDGIEGEIIIDPSEEEVAEYAKRAEDFEKLKLEWDKLKDEPTLTADGKEFELAGNIGTPRDVEGVLTNGGEAIGLYRTEFLYMDSPELPTEEEQFEAYKSVLEDMEGKAVVVRTMDIGGDKELPYLELPDEMNPFLGYRAIRISLDQDDIFRTQLRALLRASVYGTLRIMFPMIATLQEFRDAKAIYEEEREKLITENIEVSDNIEIGIMVEIPATAVLADQFAKEVDFFSIGTNDLIQYTMAADRMNEDVSYLYQPYNPSILRLIKNVIDASHAEGKWTGMCGEMAGDQIAVPLLVGMGLDEFSMSATSILQTRSLMKTLDTQKMEELVDKAINQTTTVDEVIELVEEYTN